MARAVQLTLTRLMAAIQDFIVYRGARGKGASGRLMSLFHRQFREVAQVRYVHGREAELHSILADYFCGKYHVGKPYSHPEPDRFRDPFPDDRLLPANTLFNGEGKYRVPNARRVSELVYQLMGSNRLREAIEEVCAMWEVWCV